MPWMLMLNTFTCAAEFTQWQPSKPARFNKRVDAMVANIAGAINLSRLNRISGFRCQAPGGAFLRLGEY